MSVASLRVPLLLAVLLGVAACKDEPKTQGTAPPPLPSASSGTNVCAGGGGEDTDTLTAPYFPRQVSGYCLDPSGDVKSYGEKAKLGLDQLCTTALDGGCEEYKKFGVMRSVITRYVQGTGAGLVEVFLSEFAGEGAYSIYTTRLTGEVDPADAHSMKPIDAEALGAMGTGKAYAYRGRYFLELTYSNETESPEELKKSSDAILPSLAKEIAAKLPAKPDVPASTKALPTTDLVPNGVAYFAKDAMGVKGLGAASVGYYKPATGKRYRLLSIVKPDADQAKDALKSLRGKPGALPVASLGDGAVDVVLQATPDRPKVEWVVARKGGMLLGIGDEEFVLHPDTPLAQQGDVRMSKDEKIAKLRALITPTTPGPAPKNK